MKSRTRPSIGRAIPLLLGVMTSGMAIAAQPPSGSAQAPLTYALDVGIGRSDNLTRVPVNEVAENIATAGLQFSLERTGTRLNGALDGNLRYFDYLDDTYDNELSGRFDGTMAFGIVPERFNWVVEDNYGQSLIDIFAVPTPANREGINYLSTGPDLLFNFGANGFARLFGRYAATAYEVSPLDGNRRQVGLTAGRRLSAGGSLSLNLLGERLKYDELPSNSGYDREQAFVRYENRGARTRLALDVGYTKIKDLAYTNGGKSIQLEISRNVSASSRLTLAGGIRMTDSSDRFRMADVGAISGSQTSAVTATPEVFENRSVRAGWELSGSRTNLGVSVSYNDDVYERSSLLDRKRTVGEVSLRRQVTRAFSARVVGSYSADKFEAANSDFNEWRAGAGFRLTLGRSVFLNLDADHYDRAADDVSREFVENRAFLTVGVESR